MEINDYHVDFFHEASLDKNGFCGAGSIIPFFPKRDYVIFKAGLGCGSNNFAEIFALWLLLRIEKGKGLDMISLFNDLLIIINWMT